MGSFFLVVCSNILLLSEGKSKIFVVSVACHFNKIHLCKYNYYDCERS